MPWKETCRMDEKLCFVADCLRGEASIAALCEDYGISRKTAYKWLGRYREGGPAGLLERSRAPHRHGRSMAPDVAEAIVALRRDRPHWGPRKLRAALMRARPEVVWPAASARQQQARFDRFRHDFNHNRPHEALGQRPPAAFWQPSPRPCPERLAEPWYDAWHAVRRVRSDGAIKWGGDLIFISETLKGETVGVAETDCGDWIVRFADIDLGTIDRRTRKLRGFRPARPGRAEAKQTTNTVTHVTGP